MGKSRSAITNYLRLLKLPAQVQISLQKKEIDMGHARALLSLDSPSLQLKVFKETMKNGWSVRKVEEVVNSLKNGEDIESANKKIKAKAQLSENLTSMRDQLAATLNTKVQLSCSPKGKGKISIPFSNEEELKRIVNEIGKLKEQ